jgi:hypothetical protein
MDRHGQRTIMYTVLAAVLAVISCSPQRESADSQIQAGGSDVRTSSGATPDPRNGATADPVCPIIEVGEGGPSLTIPEGAKALDIRKLGSEALSFERHVPPGMVLRHAYAVDLTGDGVEEHLVIFGNTDGSRSQAEMRSGGVIVMTNATGTLTAGSITGESGGVSFGFNNEEPIAYQTNGRNAVAIVSYWRAQGTVQLVYLLPSGAATAQICPYE